MLIELGKKPFIWIIYTLKLQITYANTNNNVTRVKHIMTMTFKPGIAFR